MNSSQLKIKHQIMTYDWKFRKDYLKLENIL